MVLSDISAILTSVKTATDIAKLLKESDVSLEKAETKLKLADLIGALADVKMQLADVRESLAAKDEEIKKLLNELKQKGNLTYEQPYYWLETENGKDGPFCPSCQDDQQKLARLIESKGTQGYWTCCVCGKNFRDSNYSPKTINRVHSKGWVMS